MHKSLKSLLAVALAFGLSGPALAADVTADTVVAKVGNEEITLGHMITMTTQLPQEYQALPDDVLYNAILDQLVRQSAAAQAIEGKLSKAAQLALENERRSFLASEVLAQKAEQAVTPEALQAAYDAAYADMPATAEYNAAHILVETQEKAQDIKDMIDGGADFAEMARTHSTGPSGPSGGELGWFTKGMMVKPFEDAVIALEKGQVSDPVQTNFGWHIIVLKDLRDKPAPSLDEVSAELADGLREAAVTAALDEFSAATPVEMSAETVDPAQLRNIQLLQD